MGRAQKTKQTNQRQIDQSISAWFVRKHGPNGAHRICYTLQPVDYFNAVTMAVVL